MELLEEPLSDEQCAVLETLLELATDSELALTAGLVWGRWQQAGRREQAFLIPLRVKQIEDRLVELSARGLLEPAAAGWHFVSPQAYHRARSLLGQAPPAAGPRSRVSPLAERAA